MNKLFRKPVYGLGISAAVGLFPVLSVAIAGSIASLNDCVVHEGYANPCVVFGIDIGEILYVMGVLGWLMLLSIPVGIAGIAGSLIWLIVTYVRYKSKIETDKT